MRTSCSNRPVQGRELFVQWRKCRHNAGSTAAARGHSAFIISELRTAFQMGFLIFVPFILIDLVVATVLMSMGMMMMPP